MANVLQPNQAYQRPVNIGRITPLKAKVSMEHAHRGFNSSTGLSAMLLAAMVSALIVVADQLLGTWADGHLMVAWIALWVVGFMAIAVFGGAARKLAFTAIGALDDWSERIAQNRADDRLWLIAQSDARVMADLKAAMSRGER